MQTTVKAQVTEMKKMKSNIEKQQKVNHPNNGRRKINNGTEVSLGWGNIEDDEGHCNIL